GPGRGDAAGACVFVANDARMGECYFGVFRVEVRPSRNSASVSALLDAGCAAPAQVADLLEHWARQRPGLAFAGDAHEKHAAVADALARLRITTVAAHADAAAIAM